MCTTSPEPDAILARAIISTLVRKGVRVLALDFDKTIVSVHTKGYWRQTTPKLAEYVRPCFRALLEAAISECDIYVSVVTYSMQPQLIRDVLLRVLPHRCEKRLNNIAFVNEYPSRLTQAMKHAIQFIHVSCHDYMRHDSYQAAQKTRNYLFILYYKT